MPAELHYPLSCKPAMIEPPGSLIPDRLLTGYRCKEAKFPDLMEACGLQVGQMFCFAGAKLKIVAVPAWQKE